MNIRGHPVIVILVLCSFALIGFMTADTQASVATKHRVQCAAVFNVAIERGGGCDVSQAPIVVANTWTDAIALTSTCSESIPLPTTMPAIRNSTGGCYVMKAPMDNDANKWTSFIGNG
jgi:hypothetical protein